MSTEKGMQEMADALKRQADALDQMLRRHRRGLKVLLASTTLGLAATILVILYAVTTDPRFLIAVWVTAPIGAVIFLVGTILLSEVGQ